MEARTQIANDTKDSLFRKIADDYSIWKLFERDQQFEDYFIRIRFGDKIKCPKCGTDKVYICNTRNQRTQFKCGNYKDGCRMNFSCLNGTPLQNMKVTFKIVFSFIYEVLEIGNDISHALAEKYGTTQKTAWNLTYLIRGGLREKGITNGLARTALKRIFPEDKITKELIEVKKAQLELNRELMGGLHKGGLTWVEYYAKNKKRIKGYHKKSYQKRKLKKKNALH